MSAMQSVFDVYQHLWSGEKRAKLEPLLSRVPVLHYPEDRDKFSKVMPHLVVLVVRKVKLKELLSLMDMGFEHIIQFEREDFAKELLASSLMTLRPQAFLKNPIPFFLSGFDSERIISDPDRHLIMRFHRSNEKKTLLEWLGVFLDRDPATSTIRDLCLQSADELITNSLFNAPIRPSGKRAFKDLPRNSEIELPTTHGCSLFACFAEERVVLGCEDSYGSLEKGMLLEHLRAIFRDDQASMKYTAGGAGLGFRHMLENSANFYVLVNEGKSTLVACAFVLKGLKANMTIAKHLHLSFHAN